VSTPNTDHRPQPRRITTDQDGTVTSAPILSATGRTSVSVAVPAYAVLAVHFPNG